MQKNREKFLVIKSGGFFGLWLQERENAGKGGGNGIMRARNAL